MPRILPAALTTAMNTGVYDPYLKVLVTPEADPDSAVAVDVLSFKIEDVQAECVVPYSTAAASALFFAIQRGVIVSGSPVTIRTSFYKVETLLTGPLGIKLIGNILPNQLFNYTNINPINYGDLILRVIGNLGWTLDQYIDYEDWGAAWLAYQFYPDGRSITISNVQRFFTIMRQKYLLFFADTIYNGTNNGTLIFQATTVRAKDYDVVDELLPHDIMLEYRRLLWRDELATIHYNGLDTYPIHNLGFLRSDQAAPTNTASPRPFKSSKLPVHLKYQTGDCVKLGTSTNYFQGRVKVTEVFDMKSNPSWHVIMEPVMWYQTTEGGALPSTLEAAAPYTPLYTGHFNHVLSAADNNLQSAMETLDDHFHSNAEVQTTDIYRCAGAAGLSEWTGTIATLPGGAVLTVNTVTGLETVLVPYASTCMAKMRVYNLTRGTYARILTHVAATHTMTLDANVPAGWQMGDSLTVLSQTVAGASKKWIDMELTSGPMNRRGIFIAGQHIGGAAGNALTIHPFQTYSASQALAIGICQVAGVSMFNCLLVKIVSNCFTMAWDGTCTLVLLREAGYL